MRVLRLVLAGIVAGVAAFTPPATAKHPDAQKSDEKSTTSPSCHAYQQAADGNWIQLPCAEMGNGHATEHRGARGADEDNR